jgi:hypothetical protein
MNGNRNACIRFDPLRPSDGIALILHWQRRTGDPSLISELKCATSVFLIIDFLQEIGCSLWEIFVEVKLHATDSCSDF